MSVHLGHPKIGGMDKEMSYNYEYVRATDSDYYVQTEWCFLNQ